MTYATINGKKYKLSARVGDVNRLLKKYKSEIDMVWEKAKNPQTLISDEKAGAFIVDMVWTFIQPRWFLKPFVLKTRFVNMVELSDLNGAGEKAFLLLHGMDPAKYLGEDRKQGNES